MDSFKKEKQIRWLSIGENRSNKRENELRIGKGGITNKDH